MRSWRHGYAVLVMHLTLYFDLSPRTTTYNPVPAMRPQCQALAASPIFLPQAQNFCLEPSIFTISTCVGTPTAKTQSRRPPMHSLAGRSSSSGPPLVRRGASHCHQGRPGESRGPRPVVLAVGRVHTLYMRGQLSATALAAVVGCARQTASARPAPQAVTENPPLYPHTVSRSGYSCYPCIQIWIQLLLLYPDPGYRSLPSIRQVSKYPCVTRRIA